MKQYKYNRTIWRLTGDGSVFLRDARGLFGSDPEVIEIPEVVYHCGKPLPVTGIWLNAFQGIRTAVKRLIIPKTVVVIRRSSFVRWPDEDNLLDLEEIIVDEANEVYAGVGAELYTKDLKTLVFSPHKSTWCDTLPEQTVSDNSFLNDRDRNLTPKRILKFHTEENDSTDKDPFQGYSDGTLNDFAPFTDENGNVNLLQYNGEQPIDAFCEITGDWNGVTLPDSVKEIAHGAFLGANIKSTNIPKHIEKIGCFAFVPWSETDTLDLPASLEKVEPLAFDRADKVKHVVLPRGVEDCDFLYNFLNLETIELKASENRKTNFVMEDGVLYSADKQTLVKYLKTKTDKEFRIPSEVVCVVAGAFRGNPYLEKVVVPRHYIETREVGMPLDKTDENLAEMFMDYHYLSAYNTERDAYTPVYAYPDIWRCGKRKWRNPMFYGCTALKELVYDDGEPVYGSEFDVVSEELEVLVPFSSVTTKPDENSFFLVDGVLYKYDYNEYTEETRQVLRYYPIERRDEVFVVDKGTTNIAELKSKYIKKLLIHNSNNKLLFRTPYVHPFHYDYLRSDIELPALEQIEVLGNGGCFFVENGCLFHKSENRVYYDIGVPGKEDWGKKRDGLWMSPNIKEDIKVKLHWKYFYLPKYDMVVRISSNGRFFAKFRQEIHYAFTEDWVDEDTGEIYTVGKVCEYNSFLVNEMELLPDCCILAEFDNLDGAFPISYKLYQTIGRDAAAYGCELVQWQDDPSVLSGLEELAASYDSLDLIANNDAKENLERADSVESLRAMKMLGYND